MLRYLNVLLTILFVFGLSGLFIVGNLKDNNEIPLFFAVKRDVHSVNVTPRTVYRRNTTVQLTKHVTKSLSELPRMDDVNAHALFLNVIPKSGAEVLVLLLQWLQGRNNFRHLRIKETRKERLTTVEQEQVVYEVVDKLRDQAIPLSFDQEGRFINFSLFDKQSPTYLGLIRNPVELAVFRYNCSSIEKVAYSCIMEHSNPTRTSNQFFGLNVPYFCGQEEEKFNSKWALMTAKKNVEKYYPVVGVLEELDSTIDVLEKKLPYFFSGAKVLYKKCLIDFKQKGKYLSNKKWNMKHFKSILKTEIEFYEWIRYRLLQERFYKKTISIHR